MSNDKKKRQIDKKPDIVQEPEATYETENNSISNDSEKLHPILEKLILKSIQDSKEGKGIPHEEVMQRVKLKYPFLK
jgi:hypothetical protein